MRSLWVSDGFNFHNRSALPSSAVIKTPLVMRTFGDGQWPAGLLVGATQSFRGGCIEGVYLYLIPFAANGVVRVDRVSGAMLLLNTWPAGFAAGTRYFSSGVHEEGDDRIFLIPNWVNMMIYLDVTTNTFHQITSWPAAATLTTSGSNPYYNGGTITDNGILYIVPGYASCLVTIDTTVSTYPSKAFCTWPLTKTNSRFSGISIGLNYAVLSLFSGGSGASQIIRMSLLTDEMTVITLSDERHYGGIYTPGSHWGLPYNAYDIVRIDAVTFTESIFYSDRLTSICLGGTFHGVRIWLAPYNIKAVVSFDVTTLTYDFFLRISRWKFR